ncbi:MAG: FG-GAP-like repeat-containing protein [Acidobacteriota bacterium]
MSRRPAHSSRRHRRLLWTGGLVLTTLATIVTVAVWRARAARTPLHRPGETLADVTRSLDGRLPDAAPEPVFTDVTVSAGLGDFVAFAGPRGSQLPEDMGGGAAWGDFDNDGDDDLFLVSNGAALDRPVPSRARSRLYRNLGNGRFAEVDSFPDTRIIGMAAAWADVDRDSWLDLAVTGYNSLLLFRNREGRLVRDVRFASPDGFWTGAAWGDFDRDGDLDLYVCGYVKYEADDASRATTQQYGTEVPRTLNPSSYRAAKNLLLVNDGAGHFTDRAAELGVDDPDGRSLGALWHDLDDDGDLDLYVANDISDNALFLDDAGEFVDAGLSAWVADYRGAMGLAAGDWNNDGDDDLFITHWIAQENALYDSLRITTAASRTDGPAAERPAGETRRTAVASTPDARHANPGTAPALRFMDVADMRGLGQIALHAIGWGTAFADLDADGWLDLVVANGSTFETDDSPPHLRAQAPFLFWNDHGQSFHDLAPRSAPLTERHVGRGLALSDYDEDGDLDLLMVQLDGGVQLLRNDTSSGHWLEVRLHDAASGRGEGARLVLTTGAIRRRRTVAGAASYLSQSTATVHFGLGAADAADRLEIHWLDGHTDTYTGLAVDSIWEITEHDPTARRLVPAAGSPPPATAIALRDDPARREQVAAFWRTYRAAVQAMRVDHDPEHAAKLFRAALSFDPDHADSRYSLGQSLARLGDTSGALEAFAELTRRHPDSHRGHRAWAMLRAATARSRRDLDAAAQELENSRRLNPEETGALAVMAEIDLLRGDPDTARERLNMVCRTNPRAGASLWLLAYITWTAGDTPGAIGLLDRAAATRVQEHRPAGATAEGDVRRAAPSDPTLLSGFFNDWDDADRHPETAFATLRAALATTRQRLAP